MKMARGEMSTPRVWITAFMAVFFIMPSSFRYRAVTNPGECRFGVISRADVADFLVRQVDDRAGKTPLLVS